MRSAAERRQAFRTMLNGADLVVAPSCPDPLTARLVERMGFPAIHASGSVFHRTMGYADAGVLTMHEMLDRIWALADGCDLPVIADADTGFGNVVNVVRTIREYERAGACAIHIEDQVTPKRPTHQGVEGETISRKEMVNKIRAAVDARSDPNFIIIARSEVKGDPKEVVERLAECVEAGADAAWAGGDEKAVRALRAATPAALVGVLPRGATAKQYKEWGANCGVIPGALQTAALHAQKLLLEELKRTGTTAGYFAGIPGIEEMQQFYSRQGNDELEAIEKRFGGG
ncbi:MAG TPA: isocitrate lyase/phosphoenolpyruvate mutase family protein [Chloroflexota bacterium]|nr:isocitrate lyase/phosphoenolpyruvate mutase family protein [Chloroflexota bacterium]